MHGSPPLVSIPLSHINQLLFVRIVSLPRQQYPALLKAFAYRSAPIRQAVFVMGRVRSGRQRTVLRRAMAPGEDVGGGECQRGGYAVQEQDMVRGGDEEDAGAGIRGGELFW